MVTTVKGFGEVGVRTDDMKYIVLGATTFTLTSEVSYEDIDGRSKFFCGDAQILDTVQQGAEIFTLTLGAKQLDRLQYEFFATGAKRDNHATITVPDRSTVTVPADGLIPVPNLNIDQVTCVTILSTDVPGDKYLTQQPNASAGGLTPVVFEAQAGVVAVDVSHAGAIAMIWTTQDLTNVEGIGGNNPINKYDSIEVMGSICGSIAGKSQIYIPSAKNTTGVAIDVTLEEQTKAFRPVVASERGMQAEYFLW